MAIYIGENEENCVLRAGQSLQHFPDIPASDNCRRISVMGNDIKSLPAKELRCPNLVSLAMGENMGLKEIPEAFFLNLTSLRVLAINGISMQSLRLSLWQLTLLEYLSLGFTEIEDISEEIGNLSYLQFLYLTIVKI
jgi:Leucine-rich repeat (LRR) protein